MIIKIYHHKEIDNGSIEISNKPTNELYKLLESGKYEPVVNIETSKVGITEALNDAFLKTVSIDGPWWEKFDIGFSVRDTSIGDIMSVIKDRHEEFYMTCQSGFRKIS